MKPYRSITRWLDVIVITFVVWSEGTIQDIFKKVDLANLAVLGTLVVAFAGVQVVDALAELAISKQRWLRRILAGSDDIEGDWVNIVVSSADPTRIKYAEYCRIRYETSGYKFNGDTWNASNRKWVGEFTTSGTNYSGRNLEYYYRTGINLVGGYGSVVFSPSDSMPTEHLCRYIDESIRVPHIARGRKVSNNLKPISFEKRRDVALQFADDFDQNGLLDLSSLS
jgi:hypothetical protein